MSKCKKSKKIWIYSTAIVVLLAGGAYYTLSETTLFPKAGNILSKCRFSPDISKQNKALIEETITTVANEGVFSLMGKQEHLEQIGKTLDKEVPDLTYWAYVLSNPTLAKDMKKIQGSSLKYDGFITGTRNKLMKEYHTNPCLLEQAEGFAKYLKLPEKETVSILKQCIDNDSEGKYEFKKFLDYIIEGKTKN
jgi:hypothetical protein